jgi:hypothetical protein
MQRWAAHGTVAGGSEPSNGDHVRVIERRERTTHHSITFDRAALQRSARTHALPREYGAAAWRARRAGREAFSKDIVARTFRYAKHLVTVALRSDRKVEWRESCAPGTGCGSDSTKLVTARGRA